MKNVKVNTVFSFCFAVLTACSPALPELPVTISITPTASPTAALFPTFMSELSIETSIAAAAINSKPVETYYDKIKVVWLECEVPQEYYHNWRFARKCLDMEFPAWQKEDSQRLGERFKVAPGEFDDIRLVIGKDEYETKHQGSRYELMRNGEIIATANSIFTTFDPNQALLNTNNKIVWELAGLNSDLTALVSIVIYDGINLLDKYSIESAYIPYVINEKLIFVAKKAGRSFVMYDEQNLGPEFEEISIGYCCGPAGYSVYRAQDQYWFWGTRDGKYFVVVLFGK